MLLVMDIGNTNVKVGIFDNNNNLKSWRVSTEAKRTADEFGMILYDLFNTQGIGFDDIEGVIVSSVAPMLNYTIEHMCTFYMNKKPIFVDCNLNTGLKFEYYNPNELGSDRIVGACAAFNLYGGPVIVIDFGSATTFNAVNSKGVYLGGMICPGIKTATESLVNTAAKLPRIELIAPKYVLGRSTVENMQAGAAYGYAGQVDYIIKKIKSEKGMKNAKVVATGGLSELVVSTDSKIIDVIDRSLSLKGLKILYDLNK